MAPTLLIEEALFLTQFPGSGGAEAAELDEIKAGISDDEEDEEEDEEGGDGGEASSAPGNPDLGASSSESLSAASASASSSSSSAAAVLTLVSPMDAAAAKACAQALGHVRGKAQAAWFSEPVDPVALGIPHYRTVVSRPMDLGTVAAKLGAGQYVSPRTFEADVLLTFANATAFTPDPAATVFQAAKFLEAAFAAKFHALMARVGRVNPAAAPSATRSAAAALPPAKSADSGLAEPAAAPMQVDTAVGGGAGGGAASASEAVKKEAVDDAAVQVRPQEDGPDSAAGGDVDGAGAAVEVANAPEERVDEGEAADLTGDNVDGGDDDDDEDGDDEDRDGGDDEGNGGDDDSDDEGAAGESDQGGDENDDAGGGYDDGDDEAREADDTMLDDAGGCGEAVKASAGRAGEPGAGELEKELRFLYGAASEDPTSRTLWRAAVEACAGCDAPLSATAAAATAAAAPSSFPAAAATEGSFALGVYALSDAARSALADIETQQAAGQVLLAGKAGGPTPVGPVRVPGGHSPAPGARSLVWAWSLAQWWPGRLREATSAKAAAGLAERGEVLVVFFGEGEGHAYAVATSNTAAFVGGDEDPHTPAKARRPLKQVRGCAFVKGCEKRCVPSLSR